MSKRTIELIQSEQDAILASADSRPEAEQSLTDDEVASFEALESERQHVIRSAHVRQVHAAGRTFSGAPAIIGAQAKGDAAEIAAFDAYLRTGIPNSDLRFAQTEGSATAGGYTVPDEWRNKLTERRIAFGGLMGEVEEITTSDGRPIAWPSVVPAAATEADIAAEGAATAVGADIVFGEVTLGAYKYVSAGTGNLPLKVSLELAQDSMFDMGAFVSAHLGKRIARKQAYDIVRGTGSGQPQGIAYGTAGTVEADPTGFSVLNQIKHALDPEYRDGAKWIMNDTTLGTLEGLLDGPSGTSGRPLLTYGQGLEDATSNGRLLGYPIVIDQAMPTWAADDVIGIAFGNWKLAYIVRHVKDVQVLVNPYAATGYIVYDAWARMDGKVQDAYAYVTGEGV